jgi:DNA-binding NtrC family response regulator
MMVAEDVASRMYVPAEAPPQERPRVLVAEDDVMLCREIEWRLQRAGYEVIPVLSARAALAAFWQVPRAVDAIVCDLQLPDGSGLALAEHLTGFRADLAVVLLGASPGRPGDVTRASSGRWEFVRKPVHPDELLAAVAGARASSSLRRAVGSSAAA